MGYTMLKNSGKPKVYDEFSLEGAALKFIRERCEGLRFDEEKAKKEENGVYLGTSLKPQQIPYNMQMDIDRLCFENAIRRFLDSGRKEDAFDVYFCYLEMFVGDYEKTRRMIELLSEFEANGSGLLMKHRDHYSHSAYVFVLGLAIYETNEVYRRIYKDKYSLNNKSESEAACHYLQYWGMTSLFHDIGYPFELPFEQVASYFEVDGDDRTQRPYVAYHDLESFVKLDKMMSRKIAKLLGGTEEVIFSTTDEMFAYLLADKLSETYLFTKEQMLTFLKEKPTQPNKFNHFMDHAYFSATVLFKKLFCELGCELSREYLDAATAILLHNSLYKFCVAYYKNDKLNIPFEAELHPLAFMLMLCDELQCWDRVAYGRNSKRELHPFGCTFNLKDNKIEATYLYDKKESAKIAAYEKSYDEWKQNEPDKSDKDQYKLWKKREPKLKAYSSMHATNKNGVSDFCQDIENIVALSRAEKAENRIELCVNKKPEDCSKSKGYLSDSNFIHLYQFATILHGRWNNIDEWKKAREAADTGAFVLDKKNVEVFTEAFKNISLEYKLSNINQAKAFAKYLNVIDCFYTDKVVGFDMLESFSEEELSKIGILEHQRWLQEHYDMGWEYGDTEPAPGMSKEEKAKKKNERELIRQHYDMIKSTADIQDEIPAELVKANYDRLGKEEQDKDKDPMECILDMLKMFDGLRIYRFPNRNN